MSEHQTCRETNAREKMRMRGRRSKANAHGTFTPRSSTGWESGKALFKGGTLIRPKRTLTWKLGVDAKSETGGFEVPSFSSTFSGAKTIVGGRLGIINITNQIIDPNIYRGLGFQPPLGNLTSRRSPPPQSEEALRASASSCLSSELIAPLNASDGRHHGQTQQCNSPYNLSKSPMQGGLYTCCCATTCNTASA